MQLAHVCRSDEDRNVQQTVCWQTVCWTAGSNCSMLCLAVLSMRYSQSSCSDPNWQLTVIPNIAVASIAVASIAVARVIVASVAIAAVSIQCACMCRQIA